MPFPTVQIEIVFIAFNRLAYTRLAIEALLSDASEKFSLVIWDNASTDGTREYLEGLNDGRITRKVLSNQNLYLTGAANECFRASKADLLAIVPDDFLVTSGWTRPLANAHAEISELGFVGCWHYGLESFDEERARHKIQTFGRHRILRHPWSGGGAGLLKRKAWLDCGPFEGIATPACWMRMARRGYINGFYVPPIPVEHMDDPWSPHYSGEISPFRKARGLDNIKKIEQQRRDALGEILDGPWRVESYLGLRGRLRRRFRRIKKCVQSSFRKS